MSRRNRLAVGAIAIVASVFLAAAVLAATQPADEAAAWYAGIAAVVGFTALLAALAGVIFAMPAYEELRQRQRERPNMQVTIQTVPARAGPKGLFESLQRDERVQVPERSYQARVLLHNAGDGVFRWGILNIQVPSECRIHPTDHDSKRHYSSQTPGDSGELEPGKVVPCNFTAAERDFPPGHHFLYHVVVEPPRAGTWPIAAVLDGYPGPRAWTRAEIVTP